MAQIVNTAAPPIPIWQSAGYSDRELEEIFYNSSPEQALVLFRHKGNGVIECAAKNNSLHYFNPTLTYFKEVFDGDNVPEITILASLHDGVDSAISDTVPVFGFCKRKSDCSTVLMPDPHYTEKRIYAESFAKLDQFLKIFHWEKKRPGAFWRGSSTGRPFLTRSEWRSNPRVRLCQISKDLADENFLDAKLAQVWQCEGPDIEQVIHSEGLVDRWIPPEAFLTFKIQIDIDGNVSSWGYFQKLYMLSAVLKVDSDYIQWYYDKLIPWIHFIPVKADLSDLTQQIRWVQDNDRAAHDIALAAREAVCGLNYGMGLEYTRDLVRRIAQYRKK
jgi:hypothetical protein